MSSRYREPEDVLKKILSIEKRLSNLERVSQAGNSSIGTGEFRLSGGDLVVADENNVEVMRVESGASPKIKMMPQGDSHDYHAEIQGSDFSGQTSIEISIEKTNVDIDGGKVLLWNNGAVLSHQPEASGDLESYISFGRWPTDIDDGQAIHLQGRFINSNSVNSEDGIYAGSISVGAGFGGLVYSYPVTYSGNMVPIVSLKSASVVQWCLTAQNNDGFTISWSDATAKIVNYFCVRLDS